MYKIKTKKQEPMTLENAVEILKQPKPKTKQEILIAQIH